MIAGKQCGIVSKIPKASLFRRVSVVASVSLVIAMLAGWMS